MSGNTQVVVGGEKVSENNIMKEEEDTVQLDRNATIKAQKVKSIVEEEKN